MTEQAPKRSEYMEKLAELRKRASEKIGRYISNKTFNESILDVADYDEDNPDKYTQDMYFATYEDNLRESHYQDEKETREYYKDKSIYLARKLGAYAMFVPGANHITSAANSFKIERQLSKKRREGYKREHGTFVSNTKKQWATAKGRLDKVNQARPTPRVQNRS